MGAVLLSGEEIRVDMTRSDGVGEEEEKEDEEAEEREGVGVTCKDEADSINDESRLRFVIDVADGEAKSAFSNNDDNDDGGEEEEEAVENGVIHAKHGSLGEVEDKWATVVASRDAKSAKVGDDDAKLDQARVSVNSQAIEFCLDIKGATSVLDELNKQSGLDEFGCNKSRSRASQSKSNARSGSTESVVVGMTVATVVVGEAHDVEVAQEEETHFGDDCIG